METRGKCVMCQHFSSTCLVLRNVGMVKCQAIKNIVTTGNEQQNVLNCALWLLFSIQSSDYGATTVPKVSLYSTGILSTVSFGSV